MLNQKTTKNTEKNDKTLNIYRKNKKKTNKKKGNEISVILQDREEDEMMVEIC